MIPPELDEIIKYTCRGIEELVRRGYFSIDWFEDIKYNNHSMLHSRMLGLLSGVLTKLGYIVDIGRAVKPVNYRKFNPDILFWRNQSPIGVIEYESTNSSDYRIIIKDLHYYEISVKNSLEDMELPKFWLIITTLPSKSVSRWSDWYLGAFIDDYCEEEYSKLDEMGYTREEIIGEFYERLKQNPKSFYYKHFIPAFKKVEKELEGYPNRPKLFLLNLNSDGLAVEYPEYILTEEYRIKWF